MYKNTIFKKKKKTIILTIIIIYYLLHDSEGYIGIHSTHTKKKNKVCGNKCSYNRTLMQ